MQRADAPRLQVLTPEMAKVKGENDWRLAVDSGRYHMGGMQIVVRDLDGDADLDVVAEKGGIVPGAEPDEEALTRVFPRLSRRNAEQPCVP